MGGWPCTTSKCTRLENGLFTEEWIGWEPKRWAKGGSQEGSCTLRFFALDVESSSSSASSLPRHSVWMIEISKRPMMFSVFVWRCEIGNRTQDIDQLRLWERQMRRRMNPGEGGWIYGNPWDWPVAHPAHHGHRTSLPPYSWLPNFFHPAHRSWATARVVVTGGSSHRLFGPWGESHQVRSVASEIARIASTTIKWLSTFQMSL